MSTFAVTLSPVRRSGGGYTRGKCKPVTLVVESDNKPAAVNAARAKGTEMGLDLWAITRIQEITKGITQ